MGYRSSNGRSNAGRVVKRMSYAAGVYLVYYIVKGA